jgi:hypothetical protein
MALPDLQSGPKLGVENKGGRGMGVADWGPYVRESEIVT